MKGGEFMAEEEKKPEENPVPAADAPKQPEGHEPEVFKKKHEHPWQKFQKTNATFKKNMSNKAARFMQRKSGKGG